MPGCRKTVAIEKSHKVHESLSSKAFDRIGALIQYAPGILPVSRSVYKNTMCVWFFMCLVFMFLEGFLRGGFIIGCGHTPDLLPECSGGGQDTRRHK